ncbi:MAG TPA: ABC transporter permease [Candidatus Acidoferrales bacterium]|nr:ABC transporter permease [Candidatus Acidoferrales bacterium]
MLGYIIRRVLQAILITIGVTLIVFILLHVIPGGGVARAILGPRANAAQIAAFNHQNGLDQPLPAQYLTYLWQLAHGNFGFSYKLNQSVASLLVQYLPKTLLLLGLAYAVSIIIAVPLGIYQAVRRNKIDDYVLTGASFVFYSMPVFWLGIILIVIFSGALHWFPSEGPQGAYVTDDFSQLSSLILPVATLALVTIASFSRYMRSSTLENMVQDYVRTARAKGASNSRVLFVHVLRNAMIPILTLIGLSVGYVFSGALITEALFNYPGMGYIFWNAALTQDYPIILGVIVVTGFATVLGSLMADIMYAIADPRVRYRRA